MLTNKFHVIVNANSMAQHVIQIKSRIMTDVNVSGKYYSNKYDK